MHLEPEIMRHGLPERLFDALSRAGFHPCRKALGLGSGVGLGLGLGEYMPGQISLASAHSATHACGCGWVGLAAQLWCWPKPESGGHWGHLWSTILTPWGRPPERHLASHTGFRLFHSVQNSAVGDPPSRTLGRGRKGTLSRHFRISPSPYTLTLLLYPILTLVQYR